MAELYPPLPADLVTFAESGVSLLVGTASATLVPDCVRALGVRVWPDARKLTVIVPAVTGATSIANLRKNPRIALTMSNVPSHRTMQVKGAVLAIRDGDERDRETATRYRALFTAELGFVGQPASTTLRLSIWPCHAVDVEIAVAFTQTPGPQAGVRLTNTGGVL